MAQKKEKSSGALLVAAGIFLSRLAGLVRERTFAHYFGNSDAGDAFKAALKIPNFLQNLLGEGVLSASMIPVYAGLRAEGKHKEADQVVRIVGTLLFILTSFLCAGGILLSPWLIAVIAPGFSGEKAALTTRLVQIFFPGIGMLVMSAWCLGVLNSHKKFFLSYVAPVLWNLAIIAALVFWGGRTDPSQLAIIAAWGLVAGSFLQLFVQIPTTASLLLSLKPQISLALTSVKSVFRNFVPVVTTRGVVQLSAYIDSMLASLLPTGAVSALAYAQTIYLLPVSLFGMAVSAAELPSMSEARGSTEEVHRYLSSRLSSGLQQIAFFVIPTVVVFLVFGDLVIGALFQTGAFQKDNTLFVWSVLAGSTVGLLAGTQGRLYASAFYSLKDARSPLKFALLRVFLTTLLGYIFAFKLPALLGLDVHWGTAGLTSSAGLAAWVEFLLLRSSMEKKIGPARLDFRFAAKVWGASLIAALPAFFVKGIVPSEWHIILRAVSALGCFAVVFLFAAFFFKIPHAQKLVHKFF